MTALAASVHRPVSHRLALRAGRALTAWGARPVRPDGYTQRVAAVEQTRDRAARLLPQLPR